MKPRTYQPKRLRDFSAVQTTAMRNLDAVIPELTQRHSVGGCELEFHMVKDDGHLAFVVPDMIATGAVDMDTEIYRSSGECPTNPAPFVPGWYHGQLAAMNDTLDTIRRTGRRFGSRVLLASAGMDPGIPTGWTGKGKDQYSVITDKPRFKRMALHALHWLKDNPPRLTVPKGEPISLLPVHGGLAASFQLNLSWPIPQFAAWRRAMIVTAAVATALSAGSPLLLGRDTGIDAVRVPAFPGAYYGFTDDQWPKYFSLAPGGYVSNGSGPLEGVDAIRKAVLDQVHPNRPFLAMRDEEAFPDHEVPEWGDPEWYSAALTDDDLLNWAEKSCYAGTRVRYSLRQAHWAAHVRFETRWSCTQPTVIDNIALAYGQNALAAGFRVLYGDKVQLGYIEAERNFCKVVRHGMRAEIKFPTRDGTCKVRPVVEIAKELLAAGRAWHIASGSQGRVREEHLGHSNGDQGFTTSEIDPLHALLMERLEKRRSFADLLRGWHDTAPDAFAVFRAVEAWGRTEKPFTTWPTTFDGAAAKL